MSKINFYLVVLLLVGCKSDSEIPFYIIHSENTEQGNLNTSEIIGDNLNTTHQFGKITEIQYNEGKLLVKDELSSSPIGFINLSDLTFTPLSREGEGPNQIQNVQLIKFNHFENNNLTFRRFGSNVIQNINIHQPFLINNTSTIPKEIINAQHVIITPESTFASCGHKMEGNFEITDSEGTQSYKVPHHLEKQNMTDEELTICTPKNIIYNAHLKTYILWRSQFNSIELFANDGNWLKSFQIGENQNFENNTLKRKFIYYYDVKSKSSVIYGLYGGFNMFDNFTQKIIPHLKSDFHIYDFETDQMEIYKLDRLVNTCDLDHENNILYCIDETNDDSPIVTYYLE